MGKNGRVGNTRQTQSSAPVVLAEGARVRLTDGSIEFSATDGAVSDTALKRSAAGVLSVGTTVLASTDLTTKPVTDAAAAVVGVSTLAAPADHVHGRPVFMPADHGMKAWSFDPAAITAGTAPSDGVLQLCLVHLPVAASITNVCLHVTAQGTSLTTGNNIAALYTSAGVKVGVTADQTVAWATAGYKAMALAGGPFTCAAGDYYVGWWINGSATDPSFARWGNSVAANNGLAAPNFRFATADGSLTDAASAPAPFTTQTAASIGWWAGLS